jgi:hypothetical protein
MIAKTYNGRVYSLWKIKDLWVRQDKTTKLISVSEDGFKWEDATKAGQLLMDWFHTELEGLLVTRTIEQILIDSLKGLVIWP